VVFLLEGGMEESMTKSRRQQLEEMLAAEPSDGELRYFLAMEHVSEGDDEGAVRCFRELFRLAPTYVPAYLQAGQVLHRLGRDDEASAVLQQGIAVAQQQRDEHAVSEMEALLDSLE
jgi:Flp pilus assembly protein TadD